MHSRLLIKCVNICITFKLKSWVLYTIVVLTFAAYAVKAEADAAAGGIEPTTKYRKYLDETLKVLVVGLFYGRQTDFLQEHLSIWTCRNNVIAMLT